MKIQGKNALITGAASGIGAAVAHALAAKGASLLLVDRDAERLRALESSLREQLSPGQALATHCVDVRDDEAVQAFHAWAEQHFYPVHILVNSAGVLRVGRFHQVTLQDWDVLYQTNLRAIVHLMQLFTPQMVDLGQGSVVNIASASGRLGFTPLTAYGTLKAALVGLGQSAGATLAQQGVVVSTICPAIVKTNIASGAGVSDERRTQLQATVDKHGISAEQVARAVVLAIEKQRALVDVGRDAHVLSLLGRLFPSVASRWIDRAAR